MVNIYVKHIVLCVCIWAGLATAAYCQRADTTVNTIDSVAVDSTTYKGSVTTDSTVAAGQDNDDEDTATSTALNKFDLKDKNFVAKEREIPSAEVKKITADDAFWYANKPMPKEKEVQASRSTPIIFWIVVGGCFIGILVLFLTSNRVWVFKSQARNIDSEEAGGGDDAEGNIFDIDFEKRINKASDAQDYRLATRLLFLRLLRSMAEKNIITYGIDKTNMDYLFELSSTKHFKDFSTASRSYEYVWYGNFTIQQGQFIHIRQLLEELTRQIKN